MYTDNLVLLDYLVRYHDELSVHDFYRLIFPEGSLLTSSEQDLPFEELRFKYGAIAVELVESVSLVQRADGSLEEHKKYSGKHFYVSDDLYGLEELGNHENFVILSPVSYAGRHRTAVNARFIYGIVIDLDGVRTEQNITDLFFQIENGHLPNPTSVVWTGQNCHLYYIFENPYPCFENIVKGFNKVKSALTKKIYNKYVTDQYKKPQIQSIFQGYRMVGSVTKSKKNRARAFLTGKKIDIDYLNSFLNQSDRVNLNIKKGKVSLEEAKEKWPDWYQRRIIEKQPKNTWKCSDKVYEWWLRRIKEEASVGHRYYAIMCLAIYAKKCGVSKERLENDAFSLVELFDSWTDDENNHFTKDDVLSALELYNDNYITFPIKTIEELTQIHIEKNKRNYRKQKQHLAIARAALEIDYPDGSWRYKTPSKRQDVIEWRKNNINGSKSQCKKETGMSYTTIRKYWDDIEDEE